MTAVAPVPPVARTAEEWGEAVRQWRGRAFHAKQIFRWIHARGVLDPSKMTDLPASMREALAGEGLGEVVSIDTERRADDQTRKILVKLRDGATIETVLIPNVTGGKSRLPNPVEQDADAAAAVDDEEEEIGNGHGESDQGIARVTQCISTQVGCAMGCVFCASGQAGLKRHLGADEIVAQVILGRSRLDAGEQLRNVVFMGMGEPLHNYDATARALRLITHGDGIGLSSRRVTVSTSGLVPEIERLGKDFAGNIGLAVSLHAADDETRSRLLPINKKYPLPKLMGALRAYPLPHRRRITIEYTLVAGRNDDVSEARKLSRLLRGLPVKINLIPMNPIADSALGPPDLTSVLAFQKVLCDDSYSCFIRRRRGDDVSAACGQLALAGAKRKIRLVS
ncbi:MAG TPA: 23S rRNA (adenine(2503)-C(2))-methyltransferase RlmN [Polyangiaceae bacterium]|nr:23S rRNA (adenine(2503)-C(2))-methyltransferase RlmN [Polyangiaceae bacterium]